MVLVAAQLRRVQIHACTQSQATKEGDLGQMHPRVHGVCMQGCPGGAVHMVGLARSTATRRARCALAGYVYTLRVFSVCVLCVCVGVGVGAFLSEELVLAPDAPGRYNVAVALYGFAYLCLMRCTAAGESMAGNLHVACSIPAVDAPLLTQAHAACWKALAAAPWPVQPPQTKTSHLVT